MLTKLLNENQLIFFQKFLHNKWSTVEDIKDVTLCAQDIDWSSFAPHLSSNSHLLKTGDRVRYETCKTVQVFRPEYDNHLLTEEHHATAALAASIQKINM